jgi:hypothetical protein
MIIVEKSADLYFFEIPHTLKTKKYYLCSRIINTVMRKFNVLKFCVYG